MIRGARAAKSAPSWQDLRAVYPPTAICRAFRIHGAHILPKPARFGCMACESCQEGAIFPPEAAFGMHGAQNLPRIDARERTAAESCHGKTPENASRENIATASRPSRSALHVGEWVQSLGCAVGFGAQHFLCEGVGIPPSRGLTAGNDFESALFRWATMSPLRVLQSCAVLCAEAKSALTFI